jgi:hypothetical protein
MKRIFTESFSVGDIAEPLVSFDGTADALEVGRIMAKRGYEVVGVRHQGVIAGYVAREDLTDGDCDDHLRPFDDGEVVSDSICFPTVVALLSERRRLFVTGFGRVGGIVTRSDLQKPPVRMWLFGMVTVIEMGFMRLIESKYPDESWKEFLSPSRLEKAEALLAERRRRNQELDLIDCLQFSDKGQIVARDEALRDHVGFPSRRRADEAVKRLEALRNNLAHSQDIIAFDWDSIVRLSESLDSVISL